MRQRKRARSEPDALQTWWREVRELGKEAYEAGKVLNLWAPVSIQGDERIKRLLVRKDYDSLYCSILVNRPGSWLVHLNGNSGIGKSAFLWYFLIRYAIDVWKIRGASFMLVYQSGDFVWRFDSSGVVSITRQSLLEVTSLQDANWHLINQKVGPRDVLGRKVLVAASPNPDNVKSAHPDRQLDVVYMFPWDRDEFDALTRLWGEEASMLEKQVEEEGLQLRSGSLEDVDLVNNAYQQEIKLGRDDVDNKVVIAGKLRAEAKLIRSRIGAADAYYRWFGGVPRKLWQLDPSKLTDVQLEKFVDAAVLTTDLNKVFRAISTGSESDHISWTLLHLKKPQAAGCQYLMDFASSSIKYKFTSTIATTKRDDLRMLLASTDPELGAVRGFLFEQDVVAKVLQAPVSAALMVDDKHCSRCDSRTDSGKGPVNWIACGVCRIWYHQLCVLHRGAPVPVQWQCQSCEGKPGDEILKTTARLRLRYYRGDLKETLLNAGADAVNHVWRPMKKNNGGFDFVILPSTLAQASTAKYHPIPFEAIQNGLAALEAWNEKYNKDSFPKRFLLSFFLTQDNYPDFGYQSYRNKQRRVSNMGVRGIMQAKVLMRTLDDEQPQLCVDIPDPKDSVEKLTELRFESIDYEGMDMVQLRALAREYGLSGYSSLKKEALIQKLAASVIEEQDEDLEFESRYHSRIRALVT